MDKLTLQDCSFWCYVGVSDAERKEKQQLFVDLELWHDLGKSGNTDDIKDTINYSEVHKEIKMLVEGKEFKLIETVVERISQQILRQFSVRKILVRVKKSLPRKNLKFAIVEIMRERN